MKGKAHSVEQKNKAGGGEREREWLVAVPVVTCGCDKTSKNMFVLCCIKQNVYRCTLVVFLDAHPVVFLCNHLPVFLFWGGERGKKNDKNIFSKKTTSFIFSCHILPTTTLLVACSLPWSNQESTFCFSLR